MRMSLFSFIFKHFSHTTRKKDLNRTTQQEPSTLNSLYKHILGSQPFPLSFMSHSGTPWWAHGSSLTAGLITTSYRMQQKTSRENTAVYAAMLYLFSENLSILLEYSQDINTESKIFRIKSHIDKIISDMCATPLTCKDLFVFFWWQKMTEWVCPGLPSKLHLP